MRTKDWLFIVLLISILTAFFNLEESIFAKEDNVFFVSFDNDFLLRPLPKKNVSINGISATNYYSFLIGKKEIVFFEKNINEKRSIASLTKLMTAIIVLENYNLDDKIIISERAVNTFGSAGNLKKGEVFSVKDLLKMVLIESSNDAAEALAEKIGRIKFISLMNEKAVEIKMSNTSFVNPSGLDFNETNVSTISDIKKLIVYIIEKHSLINDILSIGELDMYHNNIFHHKIETTNILLKEDNSYIWGKTGYTVDAGECLVLVMERPFSNDKNSYIINIIINSEDRFRDARIMEQWIKESFYW